MNVKAALDLHDHSNAVLVRLIPQIGYSLETAALDHLRHILNQLGLVHLVGQLCEYDLGASRPFLYLGLGLQQYASPTGLIGGLNPGPAHDKSSCGKVGPGQVLHQFRKRRLRLVYEVDDRSGQLIQIVGRDIGRHAHGNACRAVEEKIRELSRQHRRLFQRAVVVGHKVDGVLLNVRQHLFCNLGETNFSVAHGRCRVSVNGTEVALSIDQRIAHRECLSHSDHGLIDGRIPVGMVLTHYVSDHTSGLLIGLIVSHALFIHGVENAPVNGLQPIPDIGQSSAYDHTHGVIDVGGLHLLSDVNQYFRQKPPQTSRFFTYLACVSMNSRRGST